MYDRGWPVLARLRLSSACGTLPLWISYEPAIGPLSIRGFEQKPDWIVFGGETGPGFRPMQLEWAENLLAECREFRVPFYMKQVAARTPGMGKEFIPPHLQVQEYPGAYEDQPTFTAR